MRKLIGRGSLGVSLMALAACSGQDPQSAGSTALVSTQAPTSAGTSTSTGTFVSPNETKSYKAQGGVQSYAYTLKNTLIYSKDIVLDAAGNPVLDTNGFPTRAVNKDTRALAAVGQTQQLYSGDAATVRNPGITVSYDPRNAQYTLVIAQDNVSQSIRFQDPAHRTDFGGALEPQAGTPNLQDQGVKYLQVSLSTDPNVYDAATFFYQQPGTSTKYVTYAGYVRNRIEAPSEAVLTDATLTQTTSATQKKLLERAAFVYGEQTSNSAVPITGSATYTGNLLASMANNPNYENSQQTYFQWISGTQKTTVDFAARTVATALTGVVGAPLLDGPIITPLTVPSGVSTPNVPIGAGSTFAANASAQIDLVGKGGFTGTVSDAKFTTPAGAVQNVKIEGSSIDGAFYGPKAEEVGASFRIVGGVPDQRVDVIGSFTGARP